MHSKKGIVLGLYFFEMGILIDLQVLRSPEFENQIFNRWFTCACVYVIYQRNLKTRNFVFYITIMYWCYMKLFRKVASMILGIVERFRINVWGNNFV